MINFPVKNAGEKLTEAEVQGLRRDLLNLGGDFAETTGSGGAYVLTLDAQIDDLVAGMVVRFKANHTNPGASTLNINGIGAVDINKRSDSGIVDLEGGEIKNDSIYSIIYDGTEFQLLSESSSFIDWSWESSENISSNRAVSSIPSDPGKVEPTIRHNLQHPVETAIGSNTAYHHSCGVNDDAVAFFYINTSDSKAYCKIGLINKETLAVTWGDATQVSAGTVASEYLKVLKIEDNKLAFLYRSTSKKIDMIVAEVVNDDELSFGAELNLVTDGTYDQYSADMCLIGDHKIGIIYIQQDASTPYKLHVFNVVVSGKTITSHSGTGVMREEATTTSAPNIVCIASKATDEAVAVFQSHSSGMVTLQLDWTNNTPAVTNSEALGGTATWYSIEPISDGVYFFASIFSGGTMRGMRINSSGQLLGSVVDFSTTNNPSKTVPVSTCTFASMKMVADDRAIITLMNSSGGNLHFLEIKPTTLACVSASSQYPHNGSGDYTSIASISTDKLRFAVFSGTSAKVSILEEYDNSEYFVGFTTNSSLEGEGVGVRRMGKLDGFTETFTPGDRLYMGFNSYNITNTQSGRCFGVATGAHSCDCQQLNLDAVDISLGVKYAGTGLYTYRLYHDLGIEPKNVLVDSVVSDASRYYVGWSKGEVVDSKQYCIYWYSSDDNRTGADNSEKAGQASTKSFYNTVGANTNNGVVSVNKYYIDFVFTAFFGDFNVLVKLT